MDGVGGVLKRTADSHVLMGKDIKTASDFANLFTESAIQVKIIPDDDITSIKNMVPKTLDAIPGIMNITKITWQRGPEVSIQVYQHEHFQKELKLSMFSSDLNANVVESMDVYTPLIESPYPEEPMETNDFEDLLKFKKRHNVYKSIYNSSSSDEEDLMAISVRQQAEQKTNSVEAGFLSYSHGKENLHPNLISPGTFLLIKVPTQKENVYNRYVATSQTCADKDKGEILVTFLRSVRNSARKFKLESKDVSYIAFEQIINIIHTPLLKKEQNQEYYYFETDVDVFEQF